MILFEIWYFAESNSELSLTWDFTTWTVNSSPVVMDIWKYDAEGENHIYRIDAWYDLA